jgi:alkanesulfonate monooxygenase
MRFGVWIPSYTYPDLDYARVKQGVDGFSRKANEMGLDLWVIDHLLHAPGLYGMSWLEPMTVLTHAAAVAPDVWIGTGILVLPLRDPVVLAKEVATLDFLSGGRFQFGIGPGWYPPEFTATGTDVSERGARTDEILDAIRLLLTETNVSFEGRFYRFSDVTIEPRPPKMPQVWVAGGSRIEDPEYHDRPVMAKTVANRIHQADWWLSRCSGSQEFLKRDWDLLKTQAEEMGVPLPRFAHTNFTYLVDTADPVKAREIQHKFFRQVMGEHRDPDHLESSYLFGTIDEIVTRLKDLAQAGCEYFVIGPVSDELEQLDLLNALVIPELVDQGSH